MALVTADLTAAIGTEVLGAQLHELDDPDVDALGELVARRCVVFARNQSMTLDQQVALGKRLGELTVHPAAPGPDVYPEVFPVRADANSKFVEGTGWHTDVSCADEPPALSMLRIEACPPVGGDTLWSSMYRAFATLSPAMQSQLLDLSAFHSGEHYRGRYKNDDPQASYPTAVHPVVRTHPVTGERALYVNYGFTKKILGMSAMESTSLLRLLFDHVAWGAAFQVRWRWTPNSVAIWDNRCTQHLAIWDYFPQTRIGWRVTTKGTRPILER